LVGDVAVAGILAACVSVPITGQVFTLLSDLKKYLDEHVQAKGSVDAQPVVSLSMIVSFGMCRWTEAIAG